MAEPSVFISYSRREADRKWVREFAEALKRRGVKVWLDEVEVRAGEALDKALEKGLRASEVLVALVTRENIRSPFLLFEIGAAVAMDKRIVAIIPQDLPPEQLPSPLRARRFLFQDSPEETAKELLGETTSEERPTGERV